MAIPINPGSFGALSALASQNMSGFRLPLNTSSPLGSLFAGLNAGMQQRTENDQRQQQLDQQMQIANMQNQIAQGRLAVDQGQLGVQQGQLELDRQMAPQKMGMMQQEMELRKQQMALEQIKTRAAMDDVGLKKRGAYAAGLMVAPDIKTQDLALDNAYKNGAMSKDEYTQMKGLDFNQRKAIATQDFMQTNSAQEYKALQTPQDKNGLNMTFDPQTGQLTSLSQQPGQKAVNDLQSDVSQGVSNLNQLQSIANDYKKQYLTFTGKAYGKAGSILSAAPESIQNLASSAGLDPNEAADYRAKQKEFMGQITQMQFGIMKQLSGVNYSDQQLERMKGGVVSEDDSPADFEGKLNGFIKFSRAAMEVKQDMLRDGIPLNSPEAAKRLDKKLSEMSSKVSSENSKNTSTGSRYYFQGKPISKETYNATLQKYKAQGYSEEQIHKYLEVK